MSSEHLPCPGFQLSGGSSANYGLVFAPLKPADRDAQQRACCSATSLHASRLSSSAFRAPFVVAFEPPAISGIGSFGGFQFQLQDLGRNTLQDIDMVAHKIVADSRQRKDLTGSVHKLHRERSATTCLRLTARRAKAIGVPISEVTQALGVYMGSQYVNDFDFNNRSYRVYIQADQTFRMRAQRSSPILCALQTNGR